MAPSKEDTTNSPNWALLPEDILHEITNWLDKSSDYVRFGAVCKAWFLSTTKTYKRKHLLHTNQQLPLLLIPTQYDNDHRRLYSITKGKIFKELQLHLPFKRCCGSSHGWLFFVENDSTLELILLNPFLGDDSETIKLPPIQFDPMDEVKEMDQYGVQKAILSKDPYVSPHDYEVIAIYGRFSKLAHYKAGDKYWSYVENERAIRFSDAIFYKRLIYCVDRYNRISTLTIERSNKQGCSNNSNCSSWCLKLNTLSKQFELNRNPNAGKAYLVETSKGELLIAQRYYRDEEEPWDPARKAAYPKKSRNFKVYELCFLGEGEKMRMKKLRWTKRLYGETLFLGDNHSLCVSTSEYPGLRPNSIYFTDDNTDCYSRTIFFGSCDTGLFNIKHASFCEHYHPRLSTTKGLPPPIFVVPRCRYHPKRIV